MSQGGASYGGSHGVGSGAAKAAAPAAPQTREQQLLAQIKGNPAALMQMSDQDAADTVAAIEKLPIATDGTQRDCFVQRYINLIGWDTRKPEVLADAAYERARKQAGEDSMYHADKATNAKMGKQFNQQLMTGNQMYASEGVHGAGTYWVNNDAGNSGGYGKYQVKAFLNSKAKPITTWELRQDYAQLRRKKPKLFAALRNAKRGDYGGDAETMYPVLAAARGKNVILNVGLSPTRNTKRSRGQYVVTLDRSTLTMSSKTITNADGYTPNW